MYVFEYGRYSPYLRHKHAKPTANGTYLYTYRFNDGTKVTVELSRKDFEAVLECDHIEYNANHKEDRRRAEWPTYFDEELGEDVPIEMEDTSPRPLDLLIKKEEVLERRRQKAQFIKDTKKRLSQILTKKQVNAYIGYAYLNMKKVQIAEELGITEGAVRKLILNAEKRLDEHYKNQGLQKKRLRNSLRRKRRKERRRKKFE